MRTAQVKVGPQIVCVDGAQYRTLIGVVLLGSKVAGEHGLKYACVWDFDGTLVPGDVVAVNKTDSPENERAEYVFVSKVAAINQLYTRGLSRREILEWASHNLATAKEQLRQAKQLNAEAEQMVGLARYGEQLLSQMPRREFRRGLASQLNQAGILTMSDLVGHSQEELAEKTSWDVVHEVVGQLRLLGLSLRPDH